MASKENKMFYAAILCMKHALSRTMVRIELLCNTNLESFLPDNTLEETR